MSWLKTVNSLISKRIPVHYREREGGMRKVREIIAFLLGIAAGIAWYKFYIINLIHKVPYTICDYCRFQIEKNKMWGSGKK